MIQILQIVMLFKHFLVPSTKPLIPLRPIELINIHDEEYKKTHWI